MKARILVTGGTGFIGSHTVVALQEAGYEVVVLDNLSNSYESVLDGIARITGKKPEFYQVDLRDKPSVDDFFSKVGLLAGVVHFAAYKAVGESMHIPLDYYYNNLTSLQHLLQEMIARGVESIVFSSSCTVYAEPDILPVTEETPTRRPTSPYGNTKRISEEIIEDITSVYPIRSISLRYFNPIGAHPSGFIGELPIGVPNNLIPYITQTAIGKRSEITVFGNDYPTPDGSCIRDYIHVVDLAKAHVVALDRLLGKANNTAFEVFNLGTGKGYSVLEIIHSFEKVTGIKLNYKIGPRRKGDVPAVYADTRHANEVLGWKAGRELDDMILTAWEWEKNISKYFPDLS